MKKQHQILEWGSDGLALVCGEKIVYMSYIKYMNWDITSCIGCGMNVQTTGMYPNQKIKETI